MKGQEATVVVFWAEAQWGMFLTPRSSYFFLSICFGFSIFIFAFVFVFVFDFFWCILFILCYNVLDRSNSTLWKVYTLNCYLLKFVLIGCLQWLSTFWQLHNGRGLGVELRYCEILKEFRYLIRKRWGKSFNNCINQVNRVKFRAEHFHAVKLLSTCTHGKFCSQLSVACFITLSGYIITG